MAVKTEDSELKLLSKQKDFFSLSQRRLANLCIIKISKNNFRKLQLHI